MTDPLMPAFCCKKPEKWTRFYEMILEIDSQPYNIICLLSATCGILGSVYQILPQVTTEYIHHWYGKSSHRGRDTIVWLALSDLLASLGIFMRSVMKLVTPTIIQRMKASSVSCYLLSFWIQYFYVVSWFWTLIYAIDIWLAMKEKPSYTKTYHLFSWIAPAIFTLIGLYILYYPNGCFYSMERSFWTFFPNYLVSYLPLLTVMIINPILYYNSSQVVHIIVSQYLSQYTNRERLIVDMIKIKFSLINVAFYVCWLPNIINAILIFSSWNMFPKRVVISIWYIMAILNPLQALFNSLIYQKPENKIIFYWNQFRKNNHHCYEANERTWLLAKKSGSSNTSDEPEFVL